MVDKVCAAFVRAVNQSIVLPLEASLPQCLIAFFFFFFFLLLFHLRIWTWWVNSAQARDRCGRRMRDDEVFTLVHLVLPPTIVLYFADPL